MADLNYTNPFNTKLNDQVVEFNNNINVSPTIKVYSSVISTVPALPSELKANGVSTSVIAGSAITTAVAAPSTAQTSVGVVKNSIGDAVVVIGKTGLTPSQLERDGVIKFGTADVVYRTLKGNVTLSRSMPDRIFTGKYGINTLNDLINNPEVCSKIIAQLTVNGLDKLKGDGVITGNEPSTAVVAIATQNISPSNNITDIRGKLTSTKSLAEISLFINKIGPVLSKIKAAAAAAGIIAQYAKGFAAKKPVNLLSEIEKNKPSIPSVSNITDEVSKRVGELKVPNITDEVSKRVGELKVPKVTTNIIDSISNAKAKLSTKLFPKDNPDSFKIPPLK